MAITPDGAHLYAGNYPHSRPPRAIPSAGCSPSFCAAAPLPGCKEAGRAILSVRNDTVQKRSRVSLKWLQGESTTLMEIGDPVTDRTSYAVCVYDQTGGSPQLVADVHAPYAERCVKTHPCWEFLGPSAAPSALKYYDFYRSPDGMQKLRARPGAGGSASVTAKAQGVLLPALPSAPLTPPVAAQIVTSDGTCFGATFAGAQVKQNTSSPTVPLSFRGAR